jgi:DNA-binding transcriptional regulator YbjK
MSGDNGGWRHQTAFALQPRRRRDAERRQAVHAAARDLGRVGVPAATARLIKAC